MSHLCFIYAPLNINKYLAFITRGSINMSVHPARSLGFSMPNIDPTVVRGYDTALVALTPLTVILT